MFHEVKIYTKVIINICSMPSNLTLDYCYVAKAHELST